MTTIRYFIPEDGDTETHPNVFLCAKSRNQGAPPTLGQIKNSFPLPGRYHFRFKSPLIPGGDREKGGMAVWMDVVNDQQPVATWRQAVVAKVTRLSIEEDDDDEDDDEFIERARSGAAPSTAAHAVPSSATRAVPPKQVTPTVAAGVSAAESPLLDVFDGPSPNSAPPSAPTSVPSSAQSSTGNLLDVHTTSQVPHPTPAPASGGSLLDMDAPASYSTGGAVGGAPPSSAHNDFLGMTAGAPAQPPQQQRQQPVAAPPGTGYPQHQHQHQHQHQQRPVAAAPTAHMGAQQQQPPRAPSSGNAFESFSSNQGPFGGLEWK
mmetsp:Transcript_1714/g.2361  ORF Transcript_1714/g.2361 Transcript_1714/m.2361 type:complete len:319 (+) Transcript_1714:111-1067(+)